jgi:hypothetical protein
MLTSPKHLRMDPSYPQAAHQTKGQKSQTCRTKCRYREKTESRSGRLKDAERLLTAKDLRVLVDDIEGSATEGPTIMRGK